MTQLESIANIPTKNFLFRSNQTMNIAQFWEYTKFKRFSQLNIEIEKYLLSINKRLPSPKEAKIGHALPMSMLDDIPDHFSDREPMTVGECNRLFMILDQKAKELNITFNVEHQRRLKGEDYGF